MNKEGTGRRLLVVLGDQLSRRLGPFDDLDKKRDVVWMAEIASESQYVWSSKQRIAMFLSAMRHFREELLECGYEVRYRELGETPRRQSIGTALKAFLRDNPFIEVLMTEAGEYRVEEELKEACDAIGVPLKLYPDRHFLCSRKDFSQYAKGRKQLRMEYFYREMRRRYGVLMQDGKPIGEKWNYDSSNRKSFGKDGPEMLLQRRRFRPSDLTQTVLRVVEETFSDHPGNLDTFDWPVSRREAREALEHFIEDELPRFGDFQDAMWTGAPFLHHSLLSAALNLKLIDPKEVIDAAVGAYQKGRATIESVEGFARQILGWREYVRGLYWLYMPEYLERNELKATQSLPEFYWTGKCEMNCLREVIGQTLKHGYAHHIQRLMVTGLYALLLGVRPQEVHSWYLAVYIDAVEWVELPNTLGMSQYADGGVMGSKPYVATGKYINRMSNYCADCKFDPEQRIGDVACPFTTLYWDFLTRHRERLQRNPRMQMQIKNIERIPEEELKEIKKQAARIKKVGKN